MPKKSRVGVKERSKSIDNVYDATKGGSNPEKTFVDMMEPAEAARYEAYWKQGAGSIEKVKENGEFVYKVMNGKNINTRQRLYTVPGERSIKDVKINSKTGETYIRETIFDKYGRRIGNNDYTDHGRPDIPSHTILIIMQILIIIQHNMVTGFQDYIRIHHKRGE
ncbi:hypothetical protein [Clostridium botulinum]|uniref:hypothetical protein n=1 Tax=Clostridium botulinum TaxID=1491 RepID=UPI0003769AC3|nr:hypothetical protein [Clostridium botulinum]